MRTDVNGSYKISEMSGTLPIPVEKKISFDRYMRICWENSRTNLHYIDFKGMFEEEMKLMFAPVSREVRG